MHCAGILRPPDALVEERQRGARRPLERSEGRAHVAVLGEHAALYEGFTHFNPIQPQTFAALFEHEHNCLVAAPAASGLRVGAEFALLRLLNDATGGACRRISPRTRRRALESNDTACRRRRDLSPPRQPIAAEYSANQPKFEPTSSRTGNAPCNIISHCAEE